MSYADFIARKATACIPAGFEPSELGGHLFDFQAAIVAWACKRGRAAIFADTGLGKTAMQTEWARQVCIATGGNVLIAAPLCVAQQTVEEAAKWGIEVHYARHQDQARDGITITNYEMLDHFDPASFAGIVLDESSILKAHDSKTRTKIIDMFQATPYRLSCTATPSPNDHMELGNQAEFLGVMTATEMLAMYFIHDGGDTSQWRLKGHGKSRYWEWMATWAVCIRSPADLGFDGSRYILPGLQLHEHVLPADKPLEGQMFAGIAQTLTERRQAKRESLDARIECVRRLVHHAMETGVRREQTGQSEGEPGVCGAAKGAWNPEGQGGTEGVHGGVLQGEPDQIQKDGGAASRIQREPPQEVRGEPRIQDGSQSHRQGVAGGEPGEAQDSAHPEVRDHARSVQRTNGRAGSSVRGMRAQRQIDPELLSCSGSLPHDKQSSRHAVHELQHGVGQVQGQPGVAHERDQVSGVAPRPWLIWCHLNDEQDALEKAFGKSAFSVRGSMSPDEKEDATHRWLRGERPIMISKASILGFGLNFQHCHDMVFAGLDDSFESFYQAIRRCYRFGQSSVVDVHLVSSESEGAVKANLERKQAQANDMAESMVSHMRELTARQINGVTMEKSEYKREKAQGEGWTLHLGDCVEVARELADNVIDYSVFSPPFASLYTYSNSDRDMGNCRSYGEFYEHFRFLVKELLRVTKPGRLLSFHCMNLQTSKFRDGVIGIHDFRGELVRMFTEEGWIFHSEVCIWKDPVTAMQRTKALGLLHKTIRKDSSMSRQGIPDYLVTMRKPGDNPEPIAHTHESFPVEKWQRYASPVWMDVNPTRTLQFKTARETDDERHICPLQLDVIERAMELWSNPGDMVFSPFAGIGSEGYVAIEMGRKFVGAELKQSYWQLAQRNLGEAREHKDSGLFNTEEIEQLEAA